MTMHALAADFVTPRDGDQDTEARSTFAVSREEAVERVYRGGLLSLGGLVSFGVGISVGGLSLLAYFASYAFGFTGIVVAGIGFGVLGSAARHFARFGSPRVTLTLGASVGLGVSAILWGISGLAPLLEQIPFLRSLMGPALLGVMGFGAFIVLLTLGAVLRWLFDSEAE